MPASIIAANSRAKAEVPALRFICLSLFFLCLLVVIKFVFRQIKVTARFTIFIFFFSSVASDFRILNILSKLLGAILSTKVRPASASIFFAQA